VTVNAGFTLIDLARVRIAQARFADALTVAGEALADFRRREDPRGVAGALQCLGEAYAGLGQPERARSALRESRVVRNAGAERSGPQDSRTKRARKPLSGAALELLGS